jgi:hypothetical protein
MTFTARIQHASLDEAGDSVRFEIENSEVLDVSILTSLRLRAKRKGTTIEVPQRALQGQIFLPCCPTSAPY